MRFPRPLAAALLAAAASIPAAQAQDCARPKSDVERLVCSNDRVSEAANRMAFAFFLAYRRTPDDALRARIREEQRDWETQVRDACLDVPCLLQAYEDRTLYLEQN